MVMSKRLEDLCAYKFSIGTVYAVAQTAVSLAYGLGPLIGGQLVEHVGFPVIMRAVGLLNIVYTPVLLFLARVATPENEDKIGLDLEQAKNVIDYGATNMTTANTTASYVQPGAGQKYTELHEE